MVDMEMVKTCTICNTTYPSEEGYFYKKAKARGGGFRAACKWCVQLRRVAKALPRPPKEPEPPGPTTVSECGHYMTTITETGSRRVEFLKNYKFQPSVKDKKLVGYRSALANLI
jgi:hypothetical protein